MMKGKLWVAIGLCVLLGACSHQGKTLAVQADPPVLVTQDSFFSQFADLSFRDSHGKPFSATDLVGHTTLVNFIFTHCASICPKQTKALTGVFEALPLAVQEQVRFVSISIDPKNDDAAQLQAFAQQMGANKPNWYFLLASVQDTEQLVARLHIFDDENTDPASRPQIHRTSLWLVDRRGRMLQRYKGDPPDQARLVKELTQVNQMALSATH